MNTTGEETPLVIRPVAPAWRFYLNCYLEILKVYYINGVINPPMSLIHAYKIIEV